MPVAGLALTLHDSPSLATEALAAMDANPSVTVGEQVDRWLSVVLESPSPGASRDLHEWVESLPGVSYADVIYVGFDRPDPSHSEN